MAFFSFSSCGRRSISSILSQLPFPSSFHRSLRETSSNCGLLLQRRKIDSMYSSILSSSVRVDCVSELLSAPPSIYIASFNYYYIHSSQIHSLHLFFIRLAW
uniref:Hyp6 n=1 Tax=Moniliophthora roreri (strain MCA 2997) TaxID=1381753 RepID=F2WVJ3_MONRO|nr:hyp6 [Moniliophthora roreri]ADO51589.1 hyp6 [Moniliophthora roreri]